MRIICNLHKDHCITRFRHGYRWITLRSPNSALMLLFSRFFKSFFSKYLSINSFTIFSVFHFLLVPSLLKLKHNKMIWKNTLFQMMTGYIYKWCKATLHVWPSIVPIASHGWWCWCRAFSHWDVVLIFWMGGYGLL